MRAMVLLLVSSVASATPLDPLDYSACPNYTARTISGAIAGTTTNTDANPYDVLISSDGHWVYVSRKNGIQVFDFSSGFPVETAQSAAGDPALALANRQFSGMALTNSGTTLLAAAHDASGSQDSNLVVFDVSNPAAVKQTAAIGIPWQAGATTGPGSISVRTDGVYAWVADEYDDTVATVTLWTHAVSKLYVGNHGTNPVGMALDASLGRLFVSTEKLSTSELQANPNSKVGTILMLDVANGPAVYHGRRNGGCVPSRLKLDGNGHLVDAARASDALFVFNAGLIWNNPSAGGLINYARTGHQPLDIAFGFGGLVVLVANSARDHSTFGSMVGFYTSDVLGSVADPAPAAWYSSGGAYFSRAIAVHGSDVLMTNFDSASLRQFSVP